MGQLSIGRYQSREFQPPVTFVILDLGWTANRDLAGMFGLIRESAPLGSVFFVRVGEVLANPCAARGEGAQTGPQAADLIAELANLRHLELANQQPARVGGFTGQQVDVTVSEGALAACGGLVGGEVALFGVGDEVWRASPGERFRLVSVDIDGQAVTLLLSTDWTQSQSVQELEDLLVLGGRILDGVEF
jgi:hypothetical protein